MTRKKNSHRIPACAVCVRDGHLKCITVLPMGKNSICNAGSILFHVAFISFRVIELCPLCTTQNRGGGGLKKKVSRHCDGGGAGLSFF